MTGSDRWCVVRLARPGGHSHAVAAVAGWLPSTGKGVVMAVSEVIGERMLFCNAESCRQGRLHTLIWEVRAQKDGHETGRTPLWWTCQECGTENERED